MTAVFWIKKPSGFSLTSSLGKSPDASQHSWKLSKTGKFVSEK